VLIDELRSED
jgi:serine/threonine-protein phosphatase 2A regulatory subunit A